MANNKNIDILIVGVGKGGDSIYTDQCCSSFIIRINGENMLLVDAGFGVTKQVMTLVGDIPDKIYITHNHSDHAAQLPFILSTMCSKKRMTVYAHQHVLNKLLVYRMNEFESTENCITYWADWVSIEEQLVIIGDELSMKLEKSQHQEECYGFSLFYQEKKIFAFTADSGYNETFYRQLIFNSDCPILVDARDKGSTEHASFNEILEFQKKIPNKVYVTGYGDSINIPGLNLVQPGYILKIN